MQMIHKVLSRTVKLIADNGTTNELASKITNCPLAMMRGDPSGMVLYMFSQNKFGEGQQRPEIPPPPFREAPYSRIVQTLLQSRNTSPKTSDSGADESACLGPAELAMLFDGGKHGLATKLVAPWKPKKQSKDDGADDDAEDVDLDADDDVPDSKNAFYQSVLHICLDSDSIAARRKCVRGTMSLKQTQGIHVLSQKKLSLPEKPWGDFPGTNQGDTLQGVILPPFDSKEVWNLTWKNKKALYGKKHLIAVGGKTPDMTGPPDTRHVDKIEPVCYNPLPAVLYRAVFKGFFVKGVFDITPVESVIGWECVLEHIAYIAICFTEEHCTLLFNRFVELLKVEMANPANSNIYNPAYAVAIGNEAQTATPKAKAKVEAKGKAKGKPKPKPKVNKADDDQSEPEVEEIDDDDVWDPLKD